LPAGNLGVVIGPYRSVVTVAVRASWVIGHRGALARMPENSIEGFRWCARNGVGTVECDVRATADGVLVCSHDPTTARLGGPRDLIAELSAAAVMDIRLIGGVRVPALAEVLDVLEDRSRVVIEIKNDPGEPDFSCTRRTASLVAELLEARHREGYRDAIRAVSSFDPASAVRFAERAPHFDHCAALVSPRRSLATRVFQTALELGVTQIHPHAATVLREPWVLARARAADVEVIPWTVNGRLMARLFLGLGAAAVISDDPTQLSGPCTDFPLAPEVFRLDTAWEDDTRNVASWTRGSAGREADRFADVSGRDTSVDTVSRTRPV
jgi:glycerophosphoryl diester phosphodiesterase